MTHTYVLMDLSRAAFDEITAKMRAAGYDHAFDSGDQVIDMHGIAVATEAKDLSPPAPRVQDGKCPTCGAFGHLSADPSLIEPKVGQVYPGDYREDFFIMFLGYVCADLPELHTLECPKLLESWDRYKEMMAGEVLTTADGGSEHG